MEVGLPCVHCGLCLNTCPTYRVLGREADSPRGRIYIMEAVNEGTLKLDAEASAHLDGCLGCLACETACPSGVSFGRRIEEFRARLQTGAVSRAWRMLMQRATQSPPLLKAGVLLAAVMDGLGLQRLRRRVPGLGILPSSFARTRDAGLSPRQRSRVAAPERPRLRAGLLGGCVADLLRPDINRAAVELLHRHGVEVVDVKDQTCCGALALHGGRPDAARTMARATVQAFAAAEVDVVVTTAAGCGAMVKEYGRLLGEDPDMGPAARQIAQGARDVSQLLVECGLETPPPTAAPRARWAYHDACHLLHACAVAAAPRTVVEAATGMAPLELGDNSVCCGSAGTYNLDNPRIGVELGRRKAELARGCSPEGVAVANIGCILQLERAFVLAGLDIPVCHPVELLAGAYMEAEAKPLT